MVPSNVVHEVHYAALDQPASQRDALRDAPASCVLPAPTPAPTPFTAAPRAPVLAPSPPAPAPAAGPTPSSLPPDVQALVEAMAWTIASRRVGATSAESQPDADRTTTPARELADTLRESLATV